jgi:hypothetical protein
LKTRHVEPQHRNFGEFKVPSLRNVAETAPYMHDGQLPTLDAVLSHYVDLNLDRLHADGEQILQPLRIDARERADMVAFLKTLSDPQPMPGGAGIDRLRTPPGVARRRWTSMRACPRGVRTARRCRTGPRIGSREVPSMRHVGMASPNPNRGRRSGHGSP